MMCDLIVGFDFRQAAISYLKNLYSIVPDYIFQMLLSILCLGIVILIMWKGVRIGFQYASRLVLAEFVLLIYCYTVIYRNTCDVFKYDYHPFWSYEAIQNGRTELFAENIMNVLVFIPVGLLIGLGFSKWPWWKAVGLGCLFSISIEAIQFFFKRGFCEVDDVIHNMLGCVIGFGIVKLIMFALSAFWKRELFW